MRRPVLSQALARLEENEQRGDTGFEGAPLLFEMTSADSGTFVLSMMTTDGRLDPPASAKIVWGSLVAVITAATLLSASVEVARAMATLGAMPFSAVLILQVVGFLRALAEEGRAPGPVREGV